MGGAAGRPAGRRGGRTGRPGCTHAGERVLGGRHPACLVRFCPERDASGTSACARAVTASEGAQQRHPGQEAGRGGGPLGGGAGRPRALRAQPRCAARRRRCSRASFPSRAFFPPRAFFCYSAGGRRQPLRGPAPALLPGTRAAAGAPQAAPFFGSQPPPAAPAEAPSCRRLRCGGRLAGRAAARRLVLHASHSSPTLYQALHHRPATCTLPRRPLPAGCRHRGSG